MVELQDIIREYGNTFVQNKSMLPVQYKAMRSIANCRTAELGGHVDRYDCGHTNISYNSCRNRNCPKCQALSKERWVMARLDDLLPVPYYHVVFTLPQELNRLVFIDNTTIYDLLMKASAETLKALCLSPEYLSAEAGFISVLHTWGQNLVLHPHTHIVIPAGGLTTCGKFVVGSKKFFLPVKVMAKLFRGKFLYNLKSLRNKFNHIDEDAWNSLISTLYDKDWYVYCKRPFKNPDAVLKYLGRYTHRVAISNQRILSMENGVVSFLYRDYKDGSKKKTMQLAVHEFMRRFLLHVLPSGFRKIRHYGFLAPAVKKKKLKLCRKLLGISFTPQKPLSTRELLQKLTGRDIAICPICGKGMQLSATDLSPPCKAIG